MKEQMQTIKQTANQKGLLLIGDKFIGFKFVGDSDFKDTANKMLSELLPEDIESQSVFNEVAESLKNADYSDEAWGQ